MNSLWTLVAKEGLEAWRHYKLLWLPALFIILGAMQPLTYYYMEELLSLLGGLPEGANLSFPTLTGEQVLMDTLNQFSQIGMIAVVLSIMGVFAYERKSGEAMLVFVKPIPLWSYWLSKCLVAIMLINGSFVVGFITANYYIFFLFDPISYSTLGLTLMLYSLWLTFIVTGTLMIGTFVKSAAVVSVVSILSACFVTFFPILLGEGAMWTPAGLIVLVEDIILKTDFSIKPILATIVLVSFFIVVGIRGIYRKDWRM
ncbi:hypothetical protein [Bacillus sp. Marseille-P3800]|uniref:hypothetical protein n=1 Tax=Bacillus sp. Marseille-P3800 TaxID=2014782 RepID=UPI001145ACDB|nr:hypothetical protein [Bacillus sp. Marseille-P3800]